MSPFFLGGGGGGGGVLIVLAWVGSPPLRVRVEIVAVSDKGRIPVGFGRLMGICALVSCDTSGGGFLAVLLVISPGPGVAVDCSLVTVAISGGGGM